jgi:hypothetical protein
VPSFSSYSVIDWFFFVLAVAAFVVEVWAFVDAITRPKHAFAASGKLSKPLWLIILGVAAVIGIAGALQKLSVIGILPVVAFVAAAVYLADVRPKVRSFPKNRSGTSSGPYGPW